LYGNSRNKTLYSLIKSEPFLDGFWHEDTDGEVAVQKGKRMRVVAYKEFFARFYRVTEYEMIRQS